MCHSISTTQHCHLKWTTFQCMCTEIETQHTHSVQLRQNNAAQNAALNDLHMTKCTAFPKNKECWHQRFLPNSSLLYTETTTELRRMFEIGKGLMFKPHWMPHTSLKYIFTTTVLQDSASSTAFKERHGTELRNKMHSYTAIHCKIALIEYCLFSHVLQAAQSEASCLPGNQKDSWKGWDLGHKAQVVAVYPYPYESYLTLLPLLLSHFLLLSTDGQHSLVSLNFDIVRSVAGGISTQLKTIVKLLHSNRCSMVSSHPRY